MLVFDPEPEPEPPEERPLLSASKPKRRGLSARGVGLALVGIGVVLVLVAAWLLDRDFELANGKEAKGRVVGRDLDAGTITIRYKDRRGKRHERTFEADRRFLEGHPRGSSLELLYRPGEEDQAVPTGLTGVGGTQILLLLIGFGLAGSGLMLVIRVR